MPNPEYDKSLNSPKVNSSSFLALGTTFGSASNTPSISVKFSHNLASNAAAIYVCVKSEPPLPRVTLCPFVELPEKPAVTTGLPAFNLFPITFLTRPSDLLSISPLP